MIIQPGKAREDAQEIAIAEAMKKQLDKLKKSEEKVMDCIEVLQILDGVTGNVENMLNRMQELAERVASGTLTEEECGYCQQENEQLQKEIDRTGAEAISDSIKKYFSPDGKITLQLGESDTERISFPSREISCAAFGVDASKVDISTPEKAAKAVTFINIAQELLQGQRTIQGVVQSRLERAKEYQGL